MRSLVLKLFLVLLATTSAVVLLMLVLMRWSFDRGFVGYLEEIQQAQMSETMQRLEAFYAVNHSWYPLWTQPLRWNEITGGNRRPTPPGPGGFNRPPPPDRLPDAGAPNPPASRGNGAQRPPPPDLMDVGPRLTLFDAERRPLIGRARSTEGLIVRALKQEDETVGWLGMVPLDIPEAVRDTRFWQEQSRAFYAIAVAVILIAGLAAWLLARRLLTPVHALARGARQLAAGSYDTRVPVPGRDELGRLAADFNRLAETLEANESARRRWVADISHELRTPLAVLRGEIEALQDGVRPADATTLASLHSEAVQLGKLVDDLYQLALSDIGALTYQKREIDLGELMERVLDGIESSFSTAGLTLEREGEAGITLWADADRLTQLVQNLLQNSLRYTDRGGRVQVSWKRVGDGVQLDVQDSAPGVSDAALPHLFERLYRVDESRSRARGGAGLGLAIAQAIVQAHEGSIEARQSPLGGVWMHVRLPS